jgi:hypothetical protein
MIKVQFYVNFETSESRDYCVLNCSSTLPLSPEELNAECEKFKDEKEAEKGYACVAHGYTFRP